MTYQMPDTFTEAHKHGNLISKKDKAKTKNALNVRQVTPSIVYLIENITAQKTSFASP